MDVRGEVHEESYTWVFWMLLGVFAVATFFVAARAVLEGTRFDQDVQARELALAADAASTFDGRTTVAYSFSPAYRYLAKDSLIIIQSTKSFNTLGNPTVAYPFVGDRAAAFDAAKSSVVISHG